MQRRTAMPSLTLSHIRTLQHLLLRQPQRARRVRA